MATLNIDILMPTRDASWMFEQAAESILSQRGVSLRLLVIDDSHDPITQSRLSYLCESHPEILLIPSEGRGIVDALNTGLKYVEADFCARMDADDISLPERLRIQAEWLEHHPDHVLVGGLVRYFDDSGELLAPIDWEGLGSPITPDDIYLRLRDHNCIFHPTVMFRSKVVKDLGGYSNEYPHNEDYELWIRLAEQGLLENLPFPVLLYRLHDSQVGRESASEQEVSRARFKAERLSQAALGPRVVGPRGGHSLLPPGDILEFGCILSLSNTKHLEKAIAALDQQSNSRLSNLLVLHSLNSRAESTIMRILRNAQQQGLPVQVASFRDGNHAIQSWLARQDQSDIVILQDSRDEPSTDRVQQQGAAIAGAIGSWCLGQAEMNGIPRSALYPNEYIHRDTKLLKSREEAYFRSNVCLHMGTLQGALKDPEQRNSGSVLRSILNQLDSAQLVELPMVVSRIRLDELPVALRVRAKLANLTQEILRLLRRIKHQVR